MERGVAGPGLAGTAPGFGTAAPTFAMGEPDFGLAALALVGAALRFGIARDCDLGLGLAGAAAFGGVAFGGEDFGVALGVAAFGLLAGTGIVLDPVELRGVVAPWGLCASLAAGATELRGVPPPLPEPRGVTLPFAVPPSRPMVLRYFAIGTKTCPCWTSTWSFRICTATSRPAIWNLLGPSRATDTGREPRAASTASVTKRVSFCSKRASSLKLFREFAEVCRDKFGLSVWISSLGRSGAGCGCGAVCA